MYNNDGIQGWVNVGTLSQKEKKTFCLQVAFLSLFYRFEWFYGRIYKQCAGLIMASFFDKLKVKICYIIGIHR